MAMDQDLLNKFTARFFPEVYEYIRYGIMDRQDVYSEAFFDWDNPQFCGIISSIYIEKPLKEGTKVYDGNVYTYRNVLYIAYPADSDGQIPTEEGIIGWGYERKDGGIEWKKQDLEKNPIFHLIPLHDITHDETHEFTQQWRNKIKRLNDDMCSAKDRIYSYHYRNRERFCSHHYYKVKDKTDNDFEKENRPQSEIEKNNIFRFDLVIQYRNLKEEQVADSISTFCNIIRYISAKKYCEGAEDDFSETIKMVLGLPCAPFRYLPTLGHQLCRYIIQAFDTTKIFGRNFDIPNAGYNNLITKLLEYARQNKQYSAYEAIETIFYHKALRNNESHKQYKLTNPTPPCELFLADHILLVYTLKYILKLQPKKGVKDYFKPLERLDEISLSEFLNYKRIDYATFQVNVLAEIESIKARNESLLTNQELDEIISKHKKELFDSQKELSDELSEVKLDIADVRSQFDKYSQQLKDLQNESEAISTTLKKQNKNIKLISCALKFLSIVVLLIGAYYGVKYIVATNSAITLNGNWCLYDWVKDSKWTSPDLPYVRAKTLEKQLCDKMVQVHDAGEDMWAYSDSKDGIELRREIASTYRDAIDRYKGLFKMTSESNADEVSHLDAERAFRLSLMLFQGKGGRYSYDEALKYSEISSKGDLRFNNGTSSKGLYAYLKILNPDDRTSQDFKYAVHFIKSNRDKDDYAKLGWIRLNLDQLTHNKQGSIDSCSSIIADIVKLANKPLVRTEAIAILQILNKYKITNKRDNNLIVESLSNNYGNALLGIQLNDNNSYRYFINELGDILSKDVYMSALRAIYNNGEVVAAQELYNHCTINLNMTHDDFAERFPEMMETDKFEGKIIKTVIGSGDNVETEYKRAWEYFKNGDFDGAELCALRVNNLAKSGTHLFIEKLLHEIRLKRPDYVNEYRSRLLDSCEFKNCFNFIGNPMEASKEKAIAAYIDAQLNCRECGNEIKNSKRCDSLLSIAASLGLETAYYSRAFIRMNAGDDECGLNDLKYISKRNENACIVLAEKYLLMNPDSSMKYVNLISDSLNMYKAMRLIANQIRDNQMSGTIRYGDRNLAIKLHRAYNATGRNAMPAIKAAIIDLENFLASNDRQEFGQGVNLMLCSNVPRYGAGLLSLLKIEHILDSDKDNTFFDNIRKRLIHQMLENKYSVNFAARETAGTMLLLHYPNDTTMLAGVIDNQEIKRWTESASEFNAVADDSNYHALFLHLKYKFNPELIGRRVFSNHDNLFEYKI